MDWITVRSECFENICISEEIRRTMRWRLGDITYFVDVEIQGARRLSRLFICHGRGREERVSAESTHSQFSWDRRML